MQAYAKVHYSTLRNITEHYVKYHQKVRFTPISQYLTFVVKYVILWGALAFAQKRGEGFIQNDFRRLTMDYMLSDNDERLVLFTLVQKARYAVLYLVTLFFAPYTFKHLHHRVGQHIVTPDQLLRLLARWPNLFRDIKTIVTHRDELGRR